MLTCSGATEHVKRHAGRFGADIISETNPTCRLVIRQTACAESTDWLIAHFEKQLKHKKFYHCSVEMNIATVLYAIFFV